MRKSMVAVGLAVLALAAVASAEPSVGAAAWISPLALTRVEGDAHPELRLAQRSIDREWPALGDSGVTMIPHGRSGLGALIFSAAVPGSGQLYTGNWSGLTYAAAEVVGWLGWWALRRNADDLREEARGFVGSPEDSASAWSFTRYEQLSEADAATLRALYAVDREAFDEAIASDPRYAAGWAAPEDRSQFSDLRRRSQRRLSQSRATEGAIWVNHVVSALDALRAARLRNRSLGHGLELKAKGGWREGQPEMVVTLLRRF